MPDRDQHQCLCRPCTGLCLNRPMEKGWMVCRPCAVGWHQSETCQGFAFDTRIQINEKGVATELCAVCGHARGDHP